MEEGDETCRRNLNHNEASLSIGERTCRSPRPPGGCVCLFFFPFPFLFFVTVCVCFRVGVLFREELFDGRLPMDE